MYLAFKGIRAANVPLALGIEPPAELFEVDPRRVFGLVSDPDVLADIRRERMRELGTYVPRYADREAIERELEEARALMRRIGCIVIRTDNRAIEETAQEIIRLPRRRPRHGGLSDRVSAPVTRGPVVRYRCCNAVSPDGEGERSWRTSSACTPSVGRTAQRPKATRT